MCYPSEEPGTGPTTYSPPGGFEGAGEKGAGVKGDVAKEKRTGAEADAKQEKKQYQEQEQQKKMINFNSGTNNQTIKLTQLTKNPRMKVRGSIAPPW